jgi:hypothetical protein
MGQELDQGGLSQAGVHLSREFREDVAHRGGPLEFAFLHEHRRQQGCHRLGVGADVETVVKCNGDSLSHPSGADGPGRDDLPILDNRRGQGGKIILGEIRPEFDIERRTGRRGRGEPQDHRGDHTC